MSGKKDKKKIKNKGKMLKLTFSCIFIFCLILLGLYITFKDSVSLKKGNPIKYKDYYLASNTNEVSIFTLEDEVKEEETIKVLKENKKLPRGIKVSKSNISTVYDNKTYYNVKIDNSMYYIEDINLVETDKEVVLEDKLYVRTPNSILSIDNSDKILGQTFKGEEVTVIDYDYVDERGIVNRYTVTSSPLKVWPNIL